MITASSIVAVAPAAKRYAGELVRQMAEAGIMANPLRASMFLGQVYVESDGFRRVVESLNYGADSSMVARFVRWGRITPDQVRRFCRTTARAADQEALANVLYGGDYGRKNLGNTEAGDGWRFRGRGLKQLTGRDNYRRFSLAWLGDESLLHAPDRVAADDGAVASAVWFWGNKKLNAAADRGDVAAVTQLVNGGDVGLKERIAMTDLFRARWADFSNVSGSPT